jgi:hypothetical protein
MGTEAAVAKEMEAFEPLLEHHFYEKMQKVSGSGKVSATYLFTVQKKQFPDVSLSHILQNLSPVWSVSLDPDSLS